MKMLRKISNNTSSQPELKLNIDSKHSCSSETLQKDNNGKFLPGPHAVLVELMLEGKNGLRQVGLCLHSGHGSSHHKPSSGEFRQVLA
jgi:hypothetical protein